ncbi:MAG: minor extracellular serine protease Vpr [Acidobacteriota bacterium]|jgi:subtilisin family serine protease|nr:minor extracellular serine protease Vpr [Acidobacteriota bacterium]
MKRFLAMSALLALFGAAAQAQVEQVFPLTPAPTAATDPADESSTLWFVELKGSPKADGGAAADLSAKRQKFRQEAASMGVLFNERFAYDDLFNGMSIAVRASDVPRLKRLDSVKAVYPVETIAMPEPQPGSNPDLATAISQTQADIAQNSLGLTGAGVRVAIMDTGIDYDNPDLGGCFGAGCRVEVGYDFVGDAFNADDTSATYNPLAVPDANPDDCAGHGTHVSGIVGANGAVKGVAPGVTFSAYRVFGCEGSTTADIMIAAMERIGKDGADVLNMSIGSSYQWPQYPTAQAASRLVEKKGVIVVASAGNNGANGLYATGAPALGERVISVASFDNTHIHANALTLSPDNLPLGYFQATAAPLAPTSGSFPMARTGTTATLNDACNPLPAGSLAGKVVLIRRGTCSFNIKAIVAQNAGAAAVIIYNNVPGIQNITVVGPPQVTIPTVSVSQASGTLINNRIAAGPVTMTWTNGAVNEPNTTANLISAFSSYGLSPTLDLKPDLGAPGGFIYSTYPLEKGGHAILSGTSMASPHTVGAVALLLQAHPGLTAEQVRTVLQNTAEPHAWFGNPALGFLDNVHRQGAGMIRVADAAVATSTVTPSKLSLGEVESGSLLRTLTIHNNGATAVTYDVTHTAALATGPNTFTPAFFNGPSGVTFSAPSVTVAPGGIATVDVTITPNAGLANRSIFGGYVVLTPQGGGQTLRVPFAGFKGDYQSIQVLVPTANNFPWLAKLSGTNFINQPAGATYTLVGDDVPFLLIHFDHQSTRLEVEIRDAVTGQKLHPVFSNAIEDEFLPRNSGAATFFSFAWDGTRQHNNGNDKVKVVPDGQYRLTVKVLKALGDANNPAHWETWTSPVITLDRP